MPITMTVAELLAEYDQNKVRANARLRYLENQGIPVTISGVVSKVEELYVVIASISSDRQTIRCYYSDVRIAFLLNKEQAIAATGRVSGEDDINMFGCEFDGFTLENPPTLLPDTVKNNTVVVHCINEGLFGLIGRGTGVVMDPQEGDVLTVHHVIASQNTLFSKPSECDRVEVEFPLYGKRVPAVIAKHCASIDRALLRVDPQYLTGLPIQPHLPSNRSGSS